MAIRSLEMDVRNILAPPKLNCAGDAGPARVPASLQPASCAGPIKKLSPCIVRYAWQEYCRFCRKSALSLTIEAEPSHLQTACGLVSNACFPSALTPCRV